MIMYLAFPSHMTHETTVYMCVCVHMHLSPYGCVREMTRCKTSLLFCSPQRAIWRDSVLSLEVLPIHTHCSVAVTISKVIKTSLSPLSESSQGHGVALFKDISTKLALFTHQCRGFEGLWATETLSSLVEHRALSDSPSTLQGAALGLRSTFESKRI